MVEPSGFGLLTSQQLFTKGSRINDPQTFDQQLDHFDSSNSATWKQRCIYNDTFFVSRSRSGQVFVVIDGEEALNLRWDISGHHIEMAEKFGALVVVIEHRFYGLSTPVDQLDLKSLQLLNSEQALADSLA
jgi:serine protease 16